MHIAFTHNLRTSHDESQAEFDSPATVDALCKAMRDLGHIVTPIDVSGPSSHVIALLESTKPDLVFNTAEGKRGRFREALYPCLLEELNLPFTGSDSHTCMLTLDKQLTKLLVARAGILTPEWYFITNPSEISSCHLKYPRFVKPNFEGSSKGIRADSIVRNKKEFEKKARNLLEEFPEGILVEEYIDGEDFTVAFLNGVSASGVLPPCAYQYTGQTPSSIYDYDLKNDNCENVNVKLATFQKKERLHIEKISQDIFRSLHIRDFGRIDFRIDKHGNVYFIEINALPSLEPGAGIYIAAESLGVTSTAKVLEKIIASAALRNNVSTRKSQQKRKLKVGITYNLKRVTPKSDGEQDHEAEFDSAETINAISKAIASLGHETVQLEAKCDLISKLGTSPVDLVFNLAEGLHGRNRESQVPALLELLNVEYTGSDATTMSVTLDKWMAKKIVEENGVLTPKSAQVASIKDRLPTHLNFPLIIKPAQEGSSKGVFSNSVVNNADDLKKRILEFLPRYRQPLLIEEYIQGREFTVGLLGGRRPKVLPIMEIVFQNKKDKFPVYSFENKLNFSDQVRYDVPAILDSELRKKLEKIAKTCFQCLNCRDVARIDFRLDAKGDIYFLECNPLPGLVPDWSDLSIMAKAAGMDHKQLIANILAPAIKRLQEKKSLEYSEESNKEKKSDSMSSPRA